MSLYSKYYRFALQISRLTQFNKLLIIRLKLKHLMNYGFDLRLIELLFNKSENKIIKHTGVGFAANRTLYFSSFYHYQHKIPKIFTPRKYDCLISQGYFTEEMNLFKGPKLFYTLEPYVVFNQTEKIQLDLLSKETQNYSFSTLNRDYRLYYPSLINRKSVISILEQKLTDERDKLCCIVNRFANHNDFDLLSKRIDFVDTFSPQIDIYGHEPWGGYNGWTAYTNYKGPCKNKIETLQTYNFNLCFENSDKNGYITEKMIQALMAGTIPLYWGGGDYLVETIPQNCFINCRNLNPLNVLKSIQNMTFKEIVTYREAGLDFLKSQESDVFTKDYFLGSIVNRLKAQL